MNGLRPTRGLAPAVRSASLCSQVASLTISSTRPFSTSISRHAVPSLHPTTRQEKSGTTAMASDPTREKFKNMGSAPYKNLSPEERAAQTAERARANLQAQVQAQAGQRELGKLAPNSLFADEETPTQTSADAQGDLQLSERNTANMQYALDPNPNARARWQRKMLIRHIQHKGRLPRAVQIARTERSHLSKSHFFKTSMKKLAPLARQIAGKSIDEAILQMRFSAKKAAVDVRRHLVQARDEAIVMRGMGGATDPSESSKDDAKQAQDSPLVTDSGNSPILPHQTPTKSVRDGFEKKETDIYIAQAWTNRGPYGMEPEFRARGRVNILRPPFTGISVLLKEEKTRTREKAEKEEKSIRRRTGKSTWTALPDRPITRQSQYVLW